MYARVLAIVQLCLLLNIHHSVPCLTCYGKALTKTMPFQNCIIESVLIKSQSVSILPNIIKRKLVDLTSLSVIFGLLQVCNYFNCFLS